jgi:hypothetical protein
MEHWMELIPEHVREKYELHNYNSAVEILYQAYPEHFHNIMDALSHFSISIQDILQSGGNESEVPKKLASVMNPQGWTETKISGDLLVTLQKRKHQNDGFDLNEIRIEDFIDGHNIDFVKDKVAVDIEWNSKDQTFDRDLFAFRTFYECGIIACGVIITRSAELNPVFASLGSSIRKKYGASTTWMGKLTSRLQSRRHGGCPLLVVGITPRTIIDHQGVQTN